jgi:hypothetical protein
MKNVLHASRDTVEWFSAQHMEETVEFAQQLVANLADKSPAWSRLPRNEAATLAISA